METVLIYFLHMLNLLVVKISNMTVIGNADSGKFGRGSTAATTVPLSTVSFWRHDAVLVKATG